MEEEEEDSSLVCPSEDGGRSVGRAIETCQRQLVPGVPQRALPARLYSQKWTRLSGGDATAEMCRRALLPTLPTVQKRPQKQDTLHREANTFFTGKKM